MDIPKKRQIAAVEKLMQSEGWAIMRKTMLEEIDLVTRQLAASPTMSPEEQNYRRGMLQASYLMTDLPEKLFRRLETDLLIEGKMEGKSDAE